MKWSEVDLDKCVQYIRDSSTENNYFDMVKSILNLSVKGFDLSVKQKNIIKRFYILEVLDVDIFEDENIVQIPYSEIQKRIYGSHD